MSNLIVKEVAFNGVTLVGVQKDGKVFVVVRRICEDLGVDFSSQLKRIKRSEDLKDDISSMVIKTTEGNRDTILLDLNTLPTFLTGISSNKCKQEVRPYLKEFKQKAKELLAEAFFNKIPAPGPTIAPVILSPEELAVLQAQNILNMSRKINNIETVLNGLVADKNNSLDQLRFIEAPTVLPLQKTERAKLNQLIRSYAVSVSTPVQDIWNRLYTEFLYAYRIDIKQCANNRDIGNLDYVESLGKIPDLYSLAYKLFIAVEIKEAG